ncbi:MAG: S26 family signal peptidase [Isosphaeraceae bacterium]
MGRSTATQYAIPAAKPSTVAYRQHEGHRDTVEAVVVALILALVVRGFEAQAFVIPTGSMAPTLMGRHKEIACPECGFVFGVNASEEVESRIPRDVYSGLCGNCRNLARLDKSPSFKGDRILVMMFPYDLPFLPGSATPERWDVVVFRYPEEPEVSYIKRLVGLPDETIRIAHGDVYVKKKGSPSFVLARRPMRHQAAMQINVYDDRHQPQALVKSPEWRRWQGNGSGWKLIDPGKSSYQADLAAGPPEWAELRYRNLVPDPEQWQAVKAEQPLPREPRSTLITDFYSYNTSASVDPANPLDEPHGDQDAWIQPHWVGDLTLEANLEIKHVAPGGSVRLELIEAGVAHRCTIDLQSGSAVFTRGDSELGRASSPIRGQGRHQIQFANVDDRLTLIVDGRPVGGDGFEYNVNEPAPVPTEEDLAPVALAARNASIVASDLVVKRDIYYTQNPGRSDYGLLWDERYPRSPVELFDFLADPARLANLARVGTREFEVGSDRYFMLGDNSPRSKDSRGWGLEDSAWDPGDRKAHEVPRQLVTGKAFYVYWPHGVPVGPDLPITRDIRPFFRPYFERMKWIR